MEYLGKNLYQNYPLNHLKTPTVSFLLILNIKNFFFINFMPPFDLFKTTTKTHL